MNTGQRKIMIALLISTFLAAIEVTIISIAVPKIVTQLGGFDYISWVFAIYLFALTVSTPIWGKLADLVGRKIIFIFGVTLFLVGSTLCGLSMSMGQLIFFRLIQGVGAGAIQPASFTIIADAFDFKQRAKVQGLVSSMWGIAGLFGPLVGGFLVDYLSWRWIFLINIPFGVVSMWMIARHFVETLERKERKIDYGGAFTFTIGISALLFVLLSLNQEAEGRITLGLMSILVLLSIAIVFLIVFFNIQKKHPEPMIPFKLFQIRDVTISATALFFTSMILIGLTAYLPLWTQHVLELGATSSGLTLIPLCIGWPIAANLCGQMLPRYGTKKIAIFGVSLITAGSFGITLVTPETSLWIFGFLVLIVGMGFGFAVTVFTIVIQSSVQIELRGAAGSINTLTRTLGQTFGVAVLGAAMYYTIGQANGEISSPSMIADGLHTIFVISAIISVISLIVTVRIPQRREEDYAQRAN